MFGRAHGRILQGTLGSLVRTLLIQGTLGSLVRTLLKWYREPIVRILLLQFVLGLVVLALITTHCEIASAALCIDVCDFSRYRALIAELNTPSKGEIVQALFIHSQVYTCPT